MNGRLTSVGDSNARVVVQISQALEALSLQSGVTRVIADSRQGETNQHFCFEV